MLCDLEKALIVAVLGMSDRHAAGPHLVTEVGWDCGNATAHAEAYPRPVNLEPAGPHHAALHGTQGTCSSAPALHWWTYEPRDRLGTEGLTSRQPRRFNGNLLAVAAGAQPPRSLELKPKLPYPCPDLPSDDRV